MVTMSLCMIVKNEEALIERCLASVSGLFDEIILVDTGSTDKTKEFAAKFSCKIFDFPWKNDFAAARNYSFSKASCNYIMWLDADDILLEIDKGKLIELKQELDETYVDAIKINYNMDYDVNLNIIKSGFNFRIVKNSKEITWMGAIDEYLKISGNMIIKPDISVTQKKINCNSNKRNLEILEKLMAKFTKDNRIIYRYANELNFDKQYEKAKKYYMQVAKDKSIYRSDYAHDFFYNYVRCLVKFENEPTSIKKILLECLKNNIVSSEIYCELGRIFEQENNLEKAIFWSKLATEKTASFEYNVYNDFYYYIPYTNLSSYYYKAGSMKKSEEANEKAFAYRPLSEQLLKNKHFFISNQFANIKIGIYTHFRWLPRTYSLVNCVASQIKMLLDANIKVKLLVCEPCRNAAREGVYLDERMNGSM